MEILARLRAKPENPRHLWRGAFKMQITIVMIYFSLLKGSKNVTSHTLVRYVSLKS